VFISAMNCALLPASGCEDHILDFVLPVS